MAPMVGEATAASGEPEVLPPPESVVPSEGVVNSSFTFAPSGGSHTFSESRIGFRWFDLAKIVWAVGGFCPNVEICALAACCKNLNRYVFHDNIWKSTFYLRCLVPSSFADEAIVPLGSPQRRRAEEEFTSAFSTAAISPRAEPLLQGVTVANASNSSFGGAPVISIPGVTGTTAGRTAWRYVSNELPHSYYDFFRRWIVSPKILEGHWAFDAEKDTTPESAVYTIQAVRVIITRAKLGCPKDRHWGRMRMVIESKLGVTSLYDGLLRYSPKISAWVVQTATGGCSIRGPSYILMLKLGAKNPWPNQDKKQFLDQLGGPRLMVIPRTNTMKKGQIPDHGLIAVGRALRHSQ